MRPGTRSGAQPLRGCPRGSPRILEEHRGDRSPPSLPPPPAGRDIEGGTRRGTSGESRAGPASNNQGQSR
ncbi:hypothetical protein NDU88_005248 [Pleurodeles waltl]|uniref:Uncharacterized protein n=1 Tax=Pleurodeles waltl TaxID=8319 RepID=A0AAV7VII1_PLEWA|nr:hypothetical protein NDU88_005248 [Pleurodeles waltl]